MDHQIRIVRIDVDDVIHHDKTKYNTNNHWIDEKRPDDYDQKVNQGNTSNWINSFHDSYHTITLDSQDLTWMKKAFKVGRMTGEFSKLYQDELDDLLLKYSDVPFFDGTKYFVRTEYVSLKYGMHGAGPYTNLKEIIESMVSSIEGHTAFKDEDISCTIFLMKWLDDLDPLKEFRIFVKDNKITALSQQNLYVDNTWLKDKTDNDIRRLVYQIINHFNVHIKGHFIHVRDYVMDLAIVNDEPYFIEINSFGKEYASGSSLFHWINDYDQLYGNNKEIQIRIAIKSTP